MRIYGSRVLIVKCANGDVGSGRYTHSPSHFLFPLHRLGHYSSLLSIIYVSDFTDFVALVYV